MITHETLVLGADGLPDGVTLDGFLSEVAGLQERCAHAYFVERHVHGKPWAELKRGMPGRFGMTHRQFSSVSFLVDGQVSGILEGMETRREDLAGRVASAEKAVKGWERKRKASVARTRSTANGVLGSRRPRPPAGSRPGRRSRWPASTSSARPSSGRP